MSKYAKRCHMTIEVVEGIPIPTRQRFGGYPFLDLEIGDSFAVPRAEYTRVSSHKQLAQKRGLGRFTMQIDDANGQVRIWRIE